MLFVKNRIYNVPIISIIIPTLNEEAYIQSCLDSILKSDYDKDHMEILIIDGMGSDQTKVIASTYAQKYDFIHVIDNPERIVPIAMNMGLKCAVGEYIVRLDAHAKYPRDYFSKLITWHQRLDADNVGAVIRTEVKHCTSRSIAIKKVLSSRFGVGNSNFRVGVDTPKEVDTVPFGCYPKEVFEKYGYYDERLVRNQDIELNKRIVNNGGKIYLVPDVQCTYYARETLKDLAKNNYANGLWNILTAYYTGSVRSLSLRHFIPLFFVLSLLLPLLLSLWEVRLLWLSALSLCSYLTLVIIISLKTTDEQTTVWDLVIDFLTLHLSYGIGSLVGMFQVVIKYIKGEK
jgi:glycosyltransferase involved in cell wall biosynthesis